MLFRKSVSNFIVPKNFTELQVNYTKLEAQYFLSLIKNESTNGFLNISSPTYTSIYSVDIDSDKLSERSNSSSSTLYSKSSSLYTSVNENKTNDSHSSSKRSFSNVDICDNKVQNYSHKKICIKLDT